MRWKTFLMVSVCAAGVSASVAADDDNRIPESWLLAKYDSNGDAVISADEISRRREKVFARLDADADGDVSFEEYRDLDARRREMLLKARYEKLDWDGDGRVTAAEYRSYLGSFDRLDSDGDGNITRAEMGVDAAVAAAEQDLHCLLWFCFRSGL